MKKQDDTFKEQQRSLFAATIIATAFLIPFDNPLGAFIKIAFAVSAVLSSAYLISTAAQLKYQSPGRMYEYLKISENFKNSMFDWSVDVFGVAFLMFVSVIIVGCLQRLFRFQLSDLWTIVVVVITMLVIAVITILIQNALCKNINKKRNV